MKKVVLYTRNNCPHCDNAKKYLERNKVQYRLCNIQTPAGQKEFYKLGYKAVPVIKIGAEFMQGFTIKKFQQLYA